MMPGTVRLFVGAFLSADNQAYYARASAEWCRRHPVLRPIPPDTAHVTVAFMPSVPESDVQRLESVLQDVAGASSAIEIVLEPPAVLWARRDPRLVDARVADGSRDVMALVRTVADAIAGQTPGVEVRPAKSAHVTLARFRRSASTREGRDVEQTLAGERRRDTLEQIELMRSQLTGAGPVYTVMSAHPFTSTRNL